MLPVFSAVRQRSAPDGSDEHELHVSGSDHSLFQGWIKGCDDEAVCVYFRAVSSGLKERQLQHYHFKICNGRFDVRTQSQASKWYCTVFYGAQDAAADVSALRNGPLQVPRCMSCDMDCPLLLGITGEDPDSTSEPADKQPASTLAAMPAADLASHPAASSPPATGAEPAAAAGAAAAAASTAVAGSAANQLLQPGRQQPGATDAAAQQGTQQQQQQQQQWQAVTQQHDLQQQQQQHVMRSRDSLVRESEHCRVWFDAKGRPMFVVTPKQHIEQLADLSDAQLVDLFRTAVAVLDQMGCGCISMVLNQGDNRNHAHLHLKVKVHEKEFDRAVGGWSEQHKKQLQAIRAFRDTLPPEHRGTHEAFMLRLRQARRGRGGGGGGRSDIRGRGRGRRSDGDWRQGQQRDWQHGHPQQQQQQQHDDETL